ncbi:amidase [Marinicauda salina]|jgi:creatinine amidohydrolase/Fe(II)-dependent formamide hydrolase-like protein|uniref:Amidase n=1 Tax=Marinicauda salina TaxID=2135793 RepID=A0A2U2BVZ5_9PROT|nr:creatininase family protein [Marinicauda salina]PWE18172.1 amidase [Marinicauda salina]
MQLHQASWPEIEAYLERSKGIVIPIGSTEQHGPNGLLGTDAICPEVIAKHAGDEAGFLVGPTFNVGCAQHHLGFPGTITLRPTTMIAALNDWIESLVRCGFQRIYFLNGHGGNIATIDAAFAESYANWSLDGEACPYRLKQANWFTLPGMMELCRSIFPEGEGSHATASEVSVTYYAYPDAAKDVAMEPKIAPSGGFADAADYRARFPDGRIGSDPSQATAEKGERIVKAAAAKLIEDVEVFFAR